MIKNPPTFLKVYVIPVLLLNLVVGGWSVLATHGAPGVLISLRYAIIVTVGLYLYLFLQSSIPQDYCPLVLEGVRTVKPAAFGHFSQEVTQIELPQQAHVPLLVTVGQQETWVVQQAAREMSRIIQGAKGVMVAGVNHIWNLEAPHLFTQTVRSWVTDAPLPPACRAF